MDNMIAPKTEEVADFKLEYDENNEIHLDEIPETGFDMKYTFVNVKYYKNVVSTVRRTIEYKELIQFMKQELDVNHCSFYEGYSMENGYTIELHHAPFTLFDYVETVCTKHMKEDGYVETMKIVEEVNRLHYLFMVGLTPLNPTAHKLVHSGNLKVHPKIITGEWKLFYSEYSNYMSSAVIDKYNDAVLLEDTEDPSIPKILEYKPVKLVTPNLMLTSNELTALVYDAKLKKIETL